LDIVQSIGRTGNSPNNDCDVFINPIWWSVFLQEAETKLKETHRRLPEFWDAYIDLREEAYVPHHERTFEDEKSARVGMVAHMGMNLEKWALRIEKITWAIQHWNDPSEYMQGLLKKNTEWAKALVGNW
jgi:hypothetical protein